MPPVIKCAVRITYAEKNSTKPLRLMKKLFSYCSLSIKFSILLTPFLDYCLSLKYSLWLAVLVRVGIGDERPNLDQTREVLS